MKKLFLCKSLLSHITDFAIRDMVEHDISRLSENFNNFGNYKEFADDVTELVSVIQNHVPQLVFKQLTQTIGI